MNVNKIFLIGLDGATFRVLTPLLEQGYLPNLKKLMAAGVSTSLESVIPPVSPVAWASFMTGKTPGKHGIFEFRNYFPDEYDDRFVTTKDLKSKTLWQLLSEKGKRVIAINLPLCYPPYPVNGILISGFDTPSVESDFTYPAHIREEIFQIVPDYKFIYPEDLSKAYGTDRQFEEFLQDIKKGFAARTQIARAFITKYAWDVFMIHYQQVDTLQHEIWRYFEPEMCNELDEPRRQQIISCYAELDAHIGTLLSQLDDNTTKIVLSDHGFGHQSAYVYINHFLHKWGFLTFQSHISVSTQTAWFAGLKQKAANSRIPSIAKAYKRLQFIKHRLLCAWKKSAYLTYPQSLRDAQSFSGRQYSLSKKMTVDWEKTRVIMPFACMYGSMYLNVKQREPQGVIPPDQYDDILRQLTTNLLALKDPHSGKKMVNRVMRGTDIYSFPSPKVRIPDLVIIPNPGYAMNGDYYPDPGVEYHEIWGTHHPHGILLLSGQHICHAQPVLLPRIIDVAPTILGILGLSIPVDMDGRVLTEFFDSMKNICINGESGIETASSEKYVYSEAEEKKLVQRLKNLGYL